MEELKIPGQSAYNKPQGPSVMEQLPLADKATINVLLAILETLNRIEVRLAGSSAPVLQKSS